MTRVRWILLWGASLVLAGAAVSLISGAQIKDGTITSRDVARGTVTGRNLANGTVAAKQLAPAVQHFLANEVFGSFVVEDQAGVVQVSTKRSINRLTTTPVATSDVTTPAVGTYLLTVRNLNVGGTGGERINVAASLLGLPASGAGALLRVSADPPSTTSDTVALHVVDAAGGASSLPVGAAISVLLT